MATFSCNGASASGNPHPSFPAELPRLFNGLVQHDLVTASTQVRILEIVDETGSATVGDIVDNLPGHPDPVAAIMVMVKLRILVLDINRVVDANTIVRRGDPEPDPDGQGSNFVHPSRRSEGPASGSTMATEVLNDAFSDPVPGDGLERLLVTPFAPNIVTGSGDNRRAFGRMEEFNCPGVYALVSAKEIYIGVGAAVGQRVASGQQPIDAIDTIVIITDRNGNLTEDDAKAAERMFWSRVAASGERVLVNGRPDGASINAQRYSELDTWLGSACLALRHADILFTCGSARTVLAGPRQEPGRVAAVRPFNDIPNGEVLELSFGDGLVALAARQSAKRWLLLRGSDVRIDTVTSANSTTRYLRSAWLHSGLLEVANDGASLTVTRDLVFGSGSAVAQFATGSKGRSLESWVPIAPNGGFDPDTPAMIAA